MTVVSELEERDKLTDGPKHTNTHTHTHTHTNAVLQTETIIEILV